MQVATHSKYTYFIAFIDDFSKYYHVYLLRYKFRILDKFMYYNFLYKIKLITKLKPYNLVVEMNINLNYLIIFIINMVSNNNL